MSDIYTMTSLGRLSEGLSGAVSTYHVQRHDLMQPKTYWKTKHFTSSYQVITRMNLFLAVHIIPT